MAGSLLEEDKARAKCFAFVEDGVLRLNFLASVVFLNGLPGPLAKTLQLRGSFFDAFTDIGSQQAKAFLLAKFQRAAADPAAAQLRGEVDGPAGGRDGNLLRLFPELMEHFTLSVKGMFQELSQELRHEVRVAVSSLQLAPEAVQDTPKAAHALASDTLLVTDFLKQKFGEAGHGVPLSEVIQRLAVQSFKNYFSVTLKAVKTEELGAAALPLAGQILRAQVHYRRGDRPLMEGVWVTTQPYRRQVVTRLLREHSAAALHDRGRSRSPVIAE